MLPRRISTSITIGGRFISRKCSKPNNIITKMDRRLSYPAWSTRRRIGRRKNMQRRRCGNERWTFRESSLVGSRSELGRLNEGGTCIKIIREEIYGRISKQYISGKCG